MSELDLRQKLDMRRGFWAMGASTRIDVKLSALVKPDARTRTGTEEWTDLDVLGIQYVPMAGLVSAVADCKTSKVRATERVFWLRGVADLFGARTAYLCREGQLAPAARQLALRLGIAAMDATDRSSFLDQAGTDRLPKAGRFLDEAAYGRWESLIGTAAKETDRLQRYRRSFYWVFQQRRNLLQLPGYVQHAAKVFDVRQRWAQALLVDMAWLYLVTVLHVLDDITRLHLAELDGALQQVMLGGEAEVRDKQELFKALTSLIGENEMKRAGVGMLPPWFGDLVDITTRAARRRGHATQALRVLEFTTVETIANQGASWAEAFPDADPLDAKLASDVVRFLSRAAGLPSQFVDAFDSAVESRALLPTPPPLVAAQEAAAKEAARRSAPDAPVPALPLFAGHDAVREMGSAAAGEGNTAKVDRQPSPTRDQDG